MSCQHMQLQYVFFSSLNYFIFKKTSIIFFVDFSPNIKVHMEPSPT